MEMKYPVGLCRNSIGLERSVVQLVSVDIID